MNGWELKYTGSQSLSQSPSFNYHWFCHLIFKTIKFSQQSQLVIWAQLLQNQDFMILIMIKLGSQFVQNILELDNIFQQHSVEILPFSLQGSNCNWNKMLFKCKAFYPEISLLKAFSRWHLKQDYMNLHFIPKKVLKLERKKLERFSAIRWITFLSIRHTKFMSTSASNDIASKQGAGFCN